MAWMNAKKSNAAESLSASLRLLTALLRGQMQEKAIRALAQIRVLTAQPAKKEKKS
jgi:hypothetical protein